MKPKPILAYDTACTGASIALAIGDQMHTRTLLQSRQAAELVPAIDMLLGEYTIAYQDLDCIVSTIGPGSFTGVRIGLAALHGFVLVNQTPIKLLTTLEAMAWDVALKKSAPKEYYVALKAGKGEVYAQQFASINSIPTAQSEIALFPETKNDWDLSCFSNAADTNAAHYLAGPDATVMCRIAHHLPEATLADALPLYIRPPDAKEPAPLPWLASN